jgi:ribonuclease Z
MNSSPPRLESAPRLFTSALLGAVFGCLVLVGNAQAQSPIAANMMAQNEASQAMLATDALRVFVCGSASPLGADPSREQACIAVLAGGHLFLVDAGAGSNTNLSLGGLPMGSLHTVFLTHFHSDHITAIPDVNLASWVAGRRQPLEIAGPAGVDKVVTGFNLAFELDRGYRIEHHGEELLKPELGVLSARTLEPGTVFEEGELKITAFPVDHSPVRPAFGYRFDYGGRSVVISGDTIKIDSLIEAARGADLLFHDAMALSVVKMLQAAREEVGPESMAKILLDIQSYHAATTDVAALAREAGVSQLVFYHLVPAIANPMMTNQFLQGVPDDTILAEDGMLFVLPKGNKDIESSRIFER